MNEDRLIRNHAPASLDDANMGQAAHAGRAGHEAAVERFLWVFLIVILAGVGGGSAWKLWTMRAAASHAPSPGGPPGGIPMVTDPPKPVPDFSLVDQTGKAVTLADLKGKVWVADFFFTRCPAQCPRMNKQMGRLQKAIPDGDAMLVSITVDPDRDSPEVLAEYAERFGASDGRWLFLTGDKQIIRHFANEGFYLPVGDNPNDHSLRLVLVDRRGRIRGYYDSMSDEALEELQQRMQELLIEGRP
jgi:protein SCO1/2